jgi:predicted NAD/FAD-binding protein
MGRRRVAVIGSGVAGLTAAYVLQRGADVTLYEADGRLGGHAHTHELVAATGATVAVDSGFIVHNERTYPNLLRLFGELGVRTQDAEMSMSVYCGGCGLQYAGAKGLGGLFPTARTAANPRYLRLLTQVRSFHRRARALLADPGSAPPAGATCAEPLTLEQFLTRGGYSRYFRSHFVTPLISAVWSCPGQLAGRYPARYLFEFLANHGMLTVTGSPQWRSVCGGSARYVERAVKQLTAVHTSTPVRSLARTAGGVLIRDDADQVAAFDGAVIATHPDQALRLLDPPTAAQRAALGAFGYSVNPTVLHTDTTVLPPARRAQASWNYYLPGCAAPPESVHVSYDMNRLQRLDAPNRYLVTLNPGDTVRPDTVLERMSYAHPIFTPEAVRAQQELPALNDGVLAFAGAYHGWGFHEDGCRSGVVAARSLGVSW